MKDEVARECFWPKVFALHFPAFHGYYKGWKLHKRTLVLTNVISWLSLILNTRTIQIGVILAPYHSLPIFWDQNPSYREHYRLFSQTFKFKNHTLQDLVVPTSFLIAPGSHLKSKHAAYASSLLFLYWSLPFNNSSSPSLSVCSSVPFALLCQRCLFFKKSV